MSFPTPSSKEQTVKRIATTVAVAIVALTLASVASAYRGHRAFHGNRAPALHHHRAAY